MRTIAVIGWGSLIWNPGGLPLASGWEEGGPVLPIEFSRISDDGRLTLVIDERNGADVPTRYAVCSKTELEPAIADLQAREGARNRDRIGFVDIPTRRHSERAFNSHPKALERIRTWAAKKQFMAVIWTALGPRFKEKIGVPFSPEAAMHYVNGLAGTARARALEYIQNAPKEVMTPFRRLIISTASPQ